MSSPLPQYPDQHELVKFEDIQEGTNMALLMNLGIGVIGSTFDIQNLTGSFHSHFTLVESPNWS